MALAPQEIGRRISRRRKELGWTHQELADAMEVELRTAQRWQTGTLPRLGTLMRLADVMGVEQSYFVEDAQASPSLDDRLAALQEAVTESVALTKEAISLLREAQRQEREDPPARSSGGRR
jgi:transcriptional regulator with XRE-family HTH domain